MENRTLPAMHEDSVMAIRFHAIPARAGVRAFCLMERCVLCLGVHTMTCLALVVQGGPCMKASTDRGTEWQHFCSFFTFYSRTCDFLRTGQQSHILTEKDFFLCIPVTQLTGTESENKRQHMQSIQETRKDKKKCMGAHGCLTEEQKVATRDDKYKA